jgi:hypothetical protein
VIETTEGADHHPETGIEAVEEVETVEETEEETEENKEAKTGAEKEEIDREA